MADKEELEDILRMVVEGILRDDVWENDWCPICHEHPDSHAKKCALVEAAKVSGIDLDG